MPDYKYESGKLKRSHLLHYVDSTMGSETPQWTVLGGDVEDASVELNPETSTVKNILDETSVNDTGYEPTLDIETFYADPSDPLYPHLKNIAMNRLTGDDCKTKILEVVIDKTTGSYDAWEQTIIIKPQSYGGPQGGVNIPFNITFSGKRKNGTVEFADHLDASVTPFFIEYFTTR